MERHKCKLCFKSFSNGRALGGHMRSHMLNLPIPPKPEEEEEEEEEQQPNQLSEETESASSSSSSSEEEGGGEEEEEDEKGQFYGLREKPMRSIRLVDPEFSFAVDAGSIVLQDRESETESSKNPTRRRSKRTRKSVLLEQYHHHHHHQGQQRQEQDKLKKLKLNQLSTKTESWAEPEPVSSISDATTEEDVAFCLMMLSRDKWKKKEKQQQLEEGDAQEQEHEEVEKSIEETDEYDEFKFSTKNRVRAKYRCETCNKVFKSYQALGGHRASHKKMKACTQTHKNEQEQENAAGTSSSVVAEKKIHECPVCFRIFSSGQALGGHKRSHGTGLVEAATTAPKSSIKFGDSLIDLNLPAPIDDDDISQIELSAVSYAEFVNHVKQ